MLMKTFASSNVTDVEKSYNKWTKDPYILIQDTPTVSVVSHIYILTVFYEEGH